MSRGRPSASAIGAPSSESPSAFRTSAQRAFGDVALLVADAELGDERPDRIEDRVERVAVAGEDHPGGERAGAFAVERVEGAVDDVAGVGFAGARAFDGFGDGRR